jgi:hypothetical protein
MGSRVMNSQRICIFVRADAHESLLWVLFSQPSALEMDMRSLSFCYPSSPTQELRVHLNESTFRI